MGIEIFADENLFCGDKEVDRFADENLFFGDMVGEIFVGE